MRYAGLLLILTVIMVSCTQTKETYYPNGKIKSEQSYKGDVLNGKSFFYLPNGSLQSEYNYVDGKIEGEAKRFHPNGNLESTEMYATGLKNGEARYYNTKKALLKTVIFVNDTLHGPLKEYFPDGKVKIEGAYAHGLFDGKWVYYNEIGFQVGEGNFDKGNGVQRGYHYNGKLIREIEYQKNEKHGTEKFFNTAGKLERTDVYEAGNYVKTIAADSTSVD